MIGSWTTVLRVAGACAALLLAACNSSGSTGAEEAYTNAPQLTLVEEIRYCTNEDLPECQLMDLVFAMPAVDERVVIGMPQGPITAFDSTGAIVARYGRQGGGPGEYGFAFGVHVEPDGRVVVQDVRQSRLVVYAADGTPLVTHRLEPVFGGMRDWQFSHLGYSMLWEPQAEVGDSIVAEVRISRDTLPHIVAGRIPLVRHMSAEGFMRAPGFFQPMFPLWAAESDSTALLADGPALRIERYDKDGTMKLVVDAPALGNRAVTSEEIRAERAQRDSASAGAPYRVDPQLLNEQEANAASHHRFADRLIVLSDGSILLRENTFMSDSTRWTIFDGTGAVLGKLLLPADVKVLGGRRDRMLLQSPNELGVPIIAWHRVEAVQQ